jgi:outer membrane protein OmpA-like peptidoglycan-associated protein
MGGFDVFSSQLQPDGSWTTPVNLGYPINTAADELNFCLNAAGTIGFISTDKAGGYGKQDIYYFKVDERIRPKPVTYMKGKVYDEAMKTPLDAKLELIDLETGETIAASSSDPQTGSYLICIPTGTPLMLNVNRENYLFYSDHFSVDTSYYDLKHFEKDIPLEKPAIGVEIVLRNVFFDFNETILKEESIQELERLKKLLLDNPTMKIEISGHTDNIGSESYNKELSLNRARAVFDYLVKQGIAQDRMGYRGYGFSKPIADNSTEEGRAENRRTSFTIIAY